MDGIAWAEEACMISCWIADASREYEGIPWNRDPGWVTWQGGFPGAGVVGAGGKGNTGVVPIMVGKSVLHC